MKQIGTLEETLLLLLLEMEEGSGAANSYSIFRENRQIISPSDYSCRFKAIRKKRLSQIMV